MKDEICTKSFHENYMRHMPSMLDDYMNRTCDYCNTNFKYINRDGTINKEQYDSQLHKSIRNFQESRTEFYFKRKRKK